MAPMDDSEHLASSLSRSSSRDSSHMRGSEWTSPPFPFGMKPEGVLSGECARACAAGVGGGVMVKRYFSKYHLKDTFRSIT